MPLGVRLLIASPLGDVVAAPLAKVFDDATITVARDRTEFERAIAAQVRFDVVTADLIFNRADLEWTFDGLDVIDGLRHANRLAPVLLATQGHSMEEDHLAEARLRDDVAGVVAKADGFQALAAAMRAVALGQTVRAPAITSQRPPLFTQFDGRKGTTTARMAGAIASGNASDNATLAAVAKISVNTANKVATNYIGPLMRERHEHDERLPLTQPSVYRWCGLHARYIISWCRRHGHSDVLAPHLD
ncbi:MAG: response regulator [Gordonia amarae]